MLLSRVRSLIVACQSIINRQCVDRTSDVPLLRLLTLVVVDDANQFYANLCLSVHIHIRLSLFLIDVFLIEKLEGFAVTFDETRGDHVC